MFLFFVLVRRQTSGSGLYAKMMGTFSKSPEPKLSFPITDARGEQWPTLETGLQTALHQRVADGRSPPIDMHIRRFWAHPVDSSERSFVIALDVILHQWLHPDTASHPFYIDLLSIEIPLHRGLEQLIDAGQPEQAIELMLGLSSAMPPTDQRRLHQRFFQELFLVTTFVRFGELIHQIDPIQANIAIRSAIAFMRDELRADGVGRGQFSWKPIQDRPGRLRRLHLPHPDDLPKTAADKLWTAFMVVLSVSNEPTVFRAAVLQRLLEAMFPQA